MSSNLIVISGFSGSGKDTLVNSLCEAYPDRFCTTTSVTTRSKRSDEINGKSYYFVSKEDFESRIQRNLFIEYAKYTDDYYGTLRNELDSKLDTGKYVLLILDVQGMRSIKKFYDCTTVFLSPPSLYELRSRLQSRKSESKDSLNKRLEQGLIELECIKNYDYFLINDSKVSMLMNFCNIFARDIVIDNIRGEFKRYLSS